MLAAQTYLAVLDGFSVEAIERSVGQFIRGLVPTHDGRFAPSAAELARNVKQWDDALRLVEEVRTAKPLASGILKIDFGSGPIDMTKLSLEQQDEVLRTGKRPMVTAGPASVRLQGMAEKSRGFTVGNEQEDAA